MKRMRVKCWSCKKVFRRRYRRRHFYSWAFWSDACKECRKMKLAVAA